MKRWEWKTYYVNSTEIRVKPSITFQTIDNAPRSGVGPCHSLTHQYPFQEVFKMYYNFVIHVTILLHIWAFQMVTVLYISHISGSNSVLQRR